ncbi:MAG: hypothetical protein OCD76_22025 [Reichenbachiella sp.]
MKYYIPAVAFIALITISCSSPKEETQQTPSTVKIVQTDGEYNVLVNGEVFDVKGVGLSYNEGTKFKTLADAGGNSFRTWNTKNMDLALDSAKKYNFMVAVGLKMDKELHGFDYSDSAAVAQQLEQLKAAVDKYKNHPNVLCWVAGNELNLAFDDKGGIRQVSPRTYTSLADLVDYIHEVDPFHPVTTTFAGANKGDIAMALQACPNLDFISIQVYNDLRAIPAFIANGSIPVPFMITEFGAVGHWERATTEWGREIEETGAEKARSLAERIQIGIVNDTSGWNLGNYAFLWGQKQERTPTWYGMFNKSGDASARVDEMTKFWSGSYPSNRAPLTDSMRIDGMKSEDNIYLKPSMESTANAYVRDLEGDSLIFDWVLMTEVQVKGAGGSYEKEPETLDIAVVQQADGQLTFKAPAEEGEYRLFSYVYDGKGKVGNANVPFYVRP